jgi:adenylosuccinate synthase
MPAPTQNTVVVGLQWGDEGKGKAVDILAQRARWAVRYQGGNNAGHTLVVGGRKTVLHLIPSGALQPDVGCVIANGVVIDPEVLVRELDQLRAAGLELEAGRLHLSDRAHVILPYHRALDACREAQLADARIGTTGKGIGPVYEDKIARRGVRMGELIDPERLRARLSDLLPEKNRALREWHGHPGFGLDELLGWAAPLAARLAPCVTDTVELLHAAVDAGEPILLEGAQGTLLDVDHGTYPYVTSSTTVAGGAAAGSGLGPCDLHVVVGIAKAYTTRVGSGPFPTELDEAASERLRALGGEFGATTGRPRRCGWFDAPAVRRACRLNGVTEVCLTKLDVLDSFETLKVAVAHRSGPGGEISEYEELPGWQRETRGLTRWEELPEACQRYVLRLEALIGRPITWIGTGPGREETIRRTGAA